ncbi:two-component system sensor histidine kinase NtrB [Desulfurivibrio dismutans]|uniref:two-component system sensor histidine kinase NtrB n=1 Tax=Desulfurivibrio dismutans TaxID=1398908 RepID=UPI0023DA04F4|nr:ATP-binding protein [Desulfurivibrio alkaliphilus]MDF1613436.1 ATP-binding protein [Desulfurivibrio alkaliphilus]
MVEGKQAEGSKLAALKPFRLVKFFSFSSLAVFLAFALVLSLLISDYAKRTLLERSEAYALVVTENLSHQVFQQFVVPTVLHYGKIALRTPEQHQLLDAVVRNTTYGMRIQTVTIYDSRENIISYSTDSEKIGQRDAGGREYRNALAGESASRLVTEGEPWGALPWVTPATSQLHTFIPFIQYTPMEDKPDIIMGVIEVVQDLSEDMEAIARFQGAVILISMLMMAALFIVLRIIVGRAERIMEARAEERRRLEQQLHDSEKLATLGRMVASVSHEIKNPLGIIRSTAAILGKRVRKEAPGNEHLAEIIVSETGRLDGIVREFLDFARPQTLNRAPESINEIIRQALEFLAPELRNRGITASLELTESLPTLQLDREQIYRALLNIILNAVQAMADGGTLTLRSRRLHKMIGGGQVVEIVDTGEGIREEEREQIFSPFHTGKHRGTGLGLAIVKNIIDAHRGRIEVESEPGSGSCFRLILGKHARG